MREQRNVPKTAARRAALPSSPSEGARLGGSVRGPPTYVPGTRMAAATPGAAGTGGGKRTEKPQAEAAPRAAIRALKSDPDRDHGEISTAAPTQRYDTSKCGHRPPDARPAGRNAAGAAAAECQPRGGETGGPRVDARPRRRKCRQQGPPMPPLVAVPHATAHPMPRAASLRAHPRPPNPSRRPRSSFSPPLPAHSSQVPRSYEGGRLRAQSADVPERNALRIQKQSPRESLDSHARSSHAKCAARAHAIARRGGRASRAGGPRREAVGEGDLRGGGCSEERGGRPGRGRGIGASAQAETHAPSQRESRHSEDTPRHSAEIR